MQAIATLVGDGKDPYLKLSLRDRLIARRQRRERLQMQRRVFDVVLKIEEVIPSVPEPEPVDPIAAWVAKQKEPWFSIVEEIEPAEPRPPRVEDIQRAVALHYGVKRHDILSARRTANVVLPRQVAMYLTKQLTTRSYPDIGRRFGMRDHTTALHAFNKIARLIDTDTALADTVQVIMLSLESVRPA